MFKTNHVSDHNYNLPFFRKKYNYSDVKNSFISGLPVTASFAFAPLITLSVSMVTDNFDLYLTSAE